MEAGDSLHVKCFKHEITLKRPFKISYGVRTGQKILILELTYQGKKGYGEASEVFYYNVNREDWIKKVEELESQILRGYRFENPQDLWSFLHPHLKDDLFLMHAIDLAAWDLFGKLQNQPIYKLLGLKLDNLPISTFTIGMDPIPLMVEKMTEEAWPVYKIKLGSEEAMATVQELRKHTAAKFRIDANCSWSADQTIEFSRQLKELGVEFIEQPLPKDQLKEMEEVKRKSALPIIADESCCSEEDVEKCKDGFHGINIKLSKCGGLTPALRMIEKAKKLGLSVMVGCMLEGSIAISASAHLLPLLDFADIDASVHITKESDDGDGVDVTPSGYRFLDLPGSGVVIRDLILKQDL